MREKYWVEWRTTEEEKTIREFLLQKSDTVRLTAVTWYEGKWFIWWKKHGGDTDPEFVNTREQLQKDLINKITNNKRFDDLEQGKRARYDHYFYKLSPEMKKRINEETTFWSTTPPSSKNFYGFEDPTFYKKELKIGSVISHERYVFLYLTEEEKKIREAGIGPPEREREREREMIKT